MSFLIIVPAVGFPCLPFVITHSSLYSVTKSCTRNFRYIKGDSNKSAALSALLNLNFSYLQTGIEISYIPRDLITVIFYYQISLNPLKTQSLSQVSFPLLFPLRYIVPPVFTNSDKGKNKGKKII